VLAPGELAQGQGSFRRMTTGWKIVTVLPNRSGGAPLQEWALVAIPDKGEAIRAIKARHPHAAIRVHSEVLALPQFFETARARVQMKRTW
jgi:hypothetical protein